jgi:hypothetical protein
METSPPPAELLVAPIGPEATPMLAPPTPAIFVGAAAVVGIAGMAGSVTLEMPVLTIRLFAGALIVLCFFAIWTLCSIARVERFGEGGPPLNVSLRVAV